MEALAVLRLSVSPRRNHSGHGYLEDDEEIALPTPYTSAPSSPRRAFTREVEEAPLGEVRAAVPFDWEVIPGTPKSNLELENGPVDVSALSDETEEAGCLDHGSSSSSGGSETTKSLSRESSNSEFEFSSRFVGIVEPLRCRAPSMSTAEELFSNGQLLPLRLPPRLQAVKHLRNSDSSCSDVSSSGSFKSYHSPQSPRSPPALIAGPKMITLCGFTKTTEEMTILGMQERKQRPRSLSPLRLFNRESPAGSNLSSETYFSSDSVSSVSSSSSSSSSSSGGETNGHSSQGSPDEMNIKGSTLKDLLFTDMAMASGRIEKLKDSSSKAIAVKPRQVQSSSELKKEQDQWNGFAETENIDGTRGRPGLTPLLSRSNARSRSAPTPSIDVKSLRKEQMGRALFANRFGMLCSCLGILPESP